MTTTASESLVCHETLDMEEEVNGLCLTVATKFTLAYPSLMRQPDREGIYAMERICTGRVISPLPGVPAYIFDITGHTDYIIIDDDLVLDFSMLGPDRPLITYIRESNESSAIPNCRILIREDVFYLVATQDICAGQEVVYDANLFMLHF